MTAAIPLLVFALLAGHPTPEPVTVDVQNDGVVIDHTTEPYTVTVDTCTITVDPAVSTSVLITAGDGLELVGIVDTVSPDPVSLTVPTGSWSYSIAVVVNNHSQVSNVFGEVTCEQP